MPGARDAHDPVDGVGRHAQVERDENEPGSHGPEVGRGKIRRRWRPGQEPVAGCEAKRTQPPGGDPRPPVELVVAPGRRRPVVESEAESGPVAVRGDCLGEQVEQGIQGRPHCVVRPSYDAAVAASSRAESVIRVARHHRRVDPVRLGHAYRAIAPSEALASGRPRGEGGGLGVGDLEDREREARLGLDGDPATGCGGTRCRTSRCGSAGMARDSTACSTRRTPDSSRPWCRRLQADGWVTEVEVSFSIFGERGSIDVLGVPRGHGDRARDRGQVGRSGFAGDDRRRRSQGSARAGHRT